MMSKITSNPANFLAFGHRDGVGKSTLARTLASDWGYQVFETSTPVLAAAMAILGAQASHPEFKDSVLANCETGRQALVRIGMLGREIGGPCNWLLECGAIEAVLRQRKVVVCGIRTREEVELVNHLGGLSVRIDREGQFAAMCEETEEADWKYIFTLNKSKIGDLLTYANQFRH